MPADLHAAEDFILRNARLIDRRRWDFLFADGPVEKGLTEDSAAEAVIDALRGYQNVDGGFGHALEPDGRGSASQPLHTLSAFDALDEIAAFDHPVARAAIGYLGTILGPNGGIPNVLPSIADSPRPPWWDFAAGPAPDGALIPTGQFVGLLLAHHATPDWLPRAIDFCWSSIEAIEYTHPYEVHQAIVFLDHAPDRARAERQAERLGALVRKARLVAFDLDDLSDVRIPPGFQPGEVHTPVDYAPTPDSLARRWFTDAEIERDLEALAATQDTDGGWWFRWGRWNPATTIEWRGVMTLLALKTLRAYGRL